MNRSLAAVAALALSGSLSASGAQTAPATGMALLERMRDAYKGKWYTTLTFVQKTTARRPDGTDTVSTWYESVRWTETKGTELRIDIGDPSLGRGVLYTADSLWVVRDGKLSITRAGGNALLPLIEGVYMQRAARTARELASTGVDLARPPVSGDWQGRPVWIVGALSAADTTSPQFWVDQGNLVVVRALFPPVPGRPVMDMRFDGVTPVAGGFLAIRNSFLVDGRPVQIEEYADWKANVPLPASLFDVAQWTTGPHWAAMPKTP
jgi:hypothetical protein